MAKNIKPSVYSMKSITLQKISKVVVDEFTLLGYKKGKKKNELMEDTKAPFQGYTDGKLLVVEKSETTGERKTLNEEFCLGFVQNSFSKEEAFVLPKGWDSISDDFIRQNN